MINEQKTKDLKMNEIFEEIKRDMDDFFTEIDKAIGRTPEEPVVELIHEVDGEVVNEPVEDVLKREAK
jgi:uncharacterized FlaG/YvyC family protein